MGALSTQTGPGQDGSELEQFVLTVDADCTNGEDIPTLLRAVRTHLGMDVAFVSEFRDGLRAFRDVDAATLGCPVRAGDAGPLEDSYCARIVDGRLPQLMPDASAVPEAAALPVTAEVPVGAHLSVPIELSDGKIYGTFCCFSFTPDLSLNQRDLAVMRIFAELAAKRIEAELDAQQREAAVAKWVGAVVGGTGLSLVFQPIVALTAGRPAGYEALARFTAEPIRTPDIWFAEAMRAGFGTELDLAVIAQALAYLPDLPSDAYLAVNVAPSTVTSGRLVPFLDRTEAERIVLEITEHDLVESYEELTAALARLRRRGMRVSVDDAGAGYASFRHIVQLRPDVIKLDLSLIRGIDRDPALRALASAMLAFANQTGSTIVAEGVETPEELATLRSVGVTHAQGYHLGRPAPAPLVRAS